MSADAATTTLVPALDGEAFDPATAIRGVNRLVALGRDAALDELRSRARSAGDGAEAAAVVVLCRLVVVPPPGAPLPPLRIGVPDLVLSPGAEADWPLFPLALVDDVPFLLVREYLLGGLAETLAEHVEACATAREVRSRPLRPGSPLSAVAALLGSSAWDRLADANEGAEATAAMLRRQALRASEQGGGA
jgi:hypothetical protein